MEDLLDNSVEKPSDRTIEREPSRAAEDVFRGHDASRHETKRVAAYRQDEVGTIFHDLLQTFSQEGDDLDKIVAAGKHDGSFSR